MSDYISKEEYNALRRELTNANCLPTDPRVQALQNTRLRSMKAEGCEVVLYGDVTPNQGQNNVR